MVIGQNGPTRPPRRYFHVDFSYRSERYPYCEQTSALVGPFENVQAAIKKARASHAGATVTKVVENFIDGREPVEHPARLH